MKLKLANGHEYPIYKATKILDIVSNQSNLEIGLNGVNVETNYESLVADLGVAENLKNVTIERETGDMVFANTELVYSSLNIFDNFSEGFLVLQILENDE